MPVSLSRRAFARLISALPILGLLSRRTHGETFWQCTTEECGYIYNPALGDPDHGIAPGTAFEDLPADWLCPNCGSPKSAYIRR